MADAPRPRYATSSSLSLSDRLNPRPAFLFKPRAFGYGTGFESFVGSLPRVPFSLDGITLQIFYIFNRENIESSSKSEFEFGALSSRVDISFSFFLDVEGGRASVINDSSRIIYRPLIRGWIKASAIKLQNVRAALPSLSLSLFIRHPAPPPSAKLRGREESMGWNGIFRGGGGIIVEDIISI